jgi:hypothetical protein
MMDAIAYGTPLIRVRLDKEIGLDPLDWIAEKRNRFVAHNSEEIFTILRGILDFSEDDYRELRDEGKKFIREYFSPINDELMSAFLV